MAIKFHISSLGWCGDSVGIRFEIGYIVFEKLSVEVRYGSVCFSKQNNFKTYVKECNYCVSNVCGMQRDLNIYKRWFNIRSLCEVYKRSLPLDPCARPELALLSRLNNNNNNNNNYAISRTSEGWFASDNSDVVAQLQVGGRSALGLADWTRFCPRPGAPACLYWYWYCW